MMSSYGESGYPILGCLLSGSWPRCPDLSWSGRGHWMLPVWEELAPDHDSYTVVGEFIHPSIRLDGIWAVQSHAT